MPADKGKDGATDDSDVVVISSSVNLARRSQPFGSENWAKSLESHITGCKAKADTIRSSAEVAGKAIFSDDIIWTKRTPIPGDSIKSAHWPLYAKSLTEELHAVRTLAPQRVRLTDEWVIALLSYPLTAAKRAAWRENFDTRGHEQVRYADGQLNE